MGSNYDEIKAGVKSFWKSWTIWFNSVLAATTVGMVALQEYLPTLKAELTPGVYQKIMIGMVVVNILLRLRTTQGITGGKDQVK